MNHIHLTPTEFHSVDHTTLVVRGLLPATLKHPKTQYGYRAANDNGKSYCDWWDDIPDGDMDVLERACREGDEILDEMILSMCENKDGMYIREHLYAWDDIKYTIANTGVWIPNNEDNMFLCSSCQAWYCLDDNCNGMCVDCERDLKRTAD